MSVVASFMGQSLMFGDLLDVYQRGALVDGEMEQEEGAPVLLKAGVACYIEDINAMEVGALAAAGLQVQTAAFFPEDPGDLLRGAILKVRLRAGRVYPASNTPNLRVRRISTSNVGTCRLYRADCEGVS